MILNGRAMAERLKEEIQEQVSGKDMSLAVFVMGDDPSSKRFVEMKRKFGDAVGITVIVEQLPKQTSTEKLISQIKESAEKNQGIIVQLPLPKHIDTDAVRNAIPITHDIDVLSDEACAQFEKGALPILPPVVGAIADIVKQHAIDVKNKKVVVVGKGKLVGAPAAVWLKQQDADVTVLDSKSYDISYETMKADIVVLGAGEPELLKPDMIVEGAIILDAGTSEAAGRLTGDAHPACAAKASLFTPVPGGIGPLTVAVLFHNLLARLRWHASV